MWRNPELSGRGQRYPRDRVPSGATSQACTEVGMEPGKEQQHSLLRKNQHLLPEALSTRKLQGQVLTPQPTVLLGPACINNNTISFVLHKSQATLCKVYESMFFFFFYFQSVGIVTINFKIYLLPSLPQICTLSAHKPLFLSAP